jgi:hypothetical protein
VAGVQVGVRINNRRTNWLARMQDMEFVIFTEVFQRGRRHLNSRRPRRQRAVHAAVRAAGPRAGAVVALPDRGPRPRRSGCSPGVAQRLLLTAAVHQQGWCELRPAAGGSATRWFQGHLQSWRLVPTILRGTPRPGQAPNSLYHLSEPAAAASSPR